MSEGDSGQIDSGKPDDDDRILVAVRTEQIQYHVAGTRHGYKCSKCGCGVSIAPAGQKFLRENADVAIACLQCAMKAKPDTIEAAPGAIEEMIEDRTRRAKRHQSN